MIRFYLNRSKNKVSPIVAIYRYFAWSFKRSIGISINPHIWDKRYQKLKPIDGKAEKINSRIDDLRRKADDLAFKYKLHGIKPSMAEFQREMFGDMVKTDSIKFLDKFDAFVEYKKKLITPNSIKMYNSLRQNIVKFNPDITDMNSDQFDKFKVFLVGKNYSPNYIVKQLQILEAACNDNEIEIKQKFMIKKTEFDSIHLNEDQLLMIWNTKVSDKLENVKYLMMLMCYTGMRVQDALKYYNVKPTIIDDKPYLIYIMTKPPRKRCVIPLNISPILEAVVSKSIRKISEQNLRIYMKELCEVCGLNEPISMIRYTGTSSEVITKPFYEFVSTHTGRRSFVSNMCARRLTPQEIMPMSGHRLVEIMGIYNKTNAVDNAANLSKIFDGK